MKAVSAEQGVRRFVVVTEVVAVGRGWGLKTLAVLAKMQMVAQGGGGWGGVAYVPVRTLLCRVCNHAQPIPVPSQESMVVRWVFSCLEPNKPLQLSVGNSDTQGG